MAGFFGGGVVRYEVSTGNWVVCNSSTGQTSLVYEYLPPGGSKVHEIQTLWTHLEDGKHSQGLETKRFVKTEEEAGATFFASSGLEATIVRRLQSVTTAIKSIPWHFSSSPTGLVRGTETWLGNVTSHEVTSVGRGWGGCPPFVTSSSNRYVP